ncbi:hypothetical protein [Pseudoalteromonas sp. CnMc7-37]|uniref:hypothetical protein n=1 Tax=Pseudoalteromonas sp. CnMc7-37 TaxID=2954496 RepID=UPI00209724FF|nr:hypothetical protein [Pseudoalteromonas sp. CnMc7-37]MCO7209091.1 hypothetical protein [Pseudoalteromonas sp. CnMc7-37]
MEPIISSINDKTQYKNGDKSLCGEIIKTIYCSSTNCIVFKTGRGTTSWEYHVNNEEIEHRAVLKFSQLLNDLDSNPHEGVLSGLCNVFLAALNTNTIEECDKCFADIEKRIKNLKTPYQIKSIYILFTFIFTIFLSTVLIGTYYLLDVSFKLLFLSIAGGAVGALFSILQRNNEIKFDSQIDNKYIYLQASFTVMLGSISGGTIYLLSMSDLALSFASKNVHSLIILSIVSGFSERMVPELFGKIENNN